MSSTKAIVAFVFILLVQGVAHAQITPCPVISTSAGSPAITLIPGEYYFRDSRDANKASVMLGTNPIAPNSAEFDTLLDQVGVNEKIVRIHIRNGLQKYGTRPGDVDCVWAQEWDAVFDSAEQNGLYVLVVFDVWTDWRFNTSVPPGNWDNNVYNINSPLWVGAPCLGGGFACRTATPRTLLAAGPTRDAWEGWVAALVQRWEVRPNILGWEIFSELNLIEGIDPLNATDRSEVAAFVDHVAAVIDANDTADRPVTASLSGTRYWDELAASDIDFVELHPYADAQGGNLDDHILTSVRDFLDNLLPGNLPAKPVFIGESGLDTDLPGDPAGSHTLDPGASFGINQAIWAGAVSGAMNTRMLWFEDGYDRYHDDENGAPLDLRTPYANASLPVKAFLTEAGHEVDYSGFGPMTLTVSANLIGATLGNDDKVIGWVRGAGSVAPDWPVGPYSGESVTVAVTGQYPDWEIRYYDTTNGVLLSSEYKQRDLSGNVTFALPTFDRSIAFKMVGLAPIRVDIDVRPGVAINLIRRNSNARVPVSILTTRDFDASTVIPASVRFGPGFARAVSNTLVDEEPDMDLDLRLEFRQRAAGFDCADQRGALIGLTTGGRTILGFSPVRVEPCP